MLRVDANILSGKKMVVNKVNKEMKQIKANGK